MTGLLILMLQGRLYFPLATFYLNLLIWTLSLHNKNIRAPDSSLVFGAESCWKKYSELLTVHLYWGWVLLLLPLSFSLLFLTFPGAWFKFLPLVVVICAFNICVCLSLFPSLWRYIEETRKKRLIVVSKACFMLQPVRYNSLPVEFCICSATFSSLLMYSFISCIACPCIPLGCILQLTMRCRGYCFSWSFLWLL